jgi:hypothetical protein
MEEHKKARRRADAQRAPLADDRFRVDVDDGDRSSKLPPMPGGPVEVSTPTPAPASAAVVQPYSGASTVRLPEPAPPAALPANDLRGSESAEPVSLGAESAAARPAKPSDEDRKLRGIILLAVAGFVVAAGGVFALRAVLAPPPVVETPAPAVVTGAGAEVPSDPAPSAVPSADPSSDRFLDLDTEDPAGSAEPSSTSRKRPRKPQTGGQPAPTGPTTGAAPAPSPPAGAGTSTSPGRRSPVIF